MVDKPQPDNEYENIKENINKCQQMLSNGFADDACRGSSVSTRAGTVPGWPGGVGACGNDGCSC